MPKKIDDAGLTKGQLRKLNALRKSLGSDIADKAFSEWLKVSPITVSAISFGTLASVFSWMAKVPTGPERARDSQTSFGFGDMRVV